jgi:hypothetical protein
MNKRLSLVFLFSFFMLTACGGGGSDNPTDPGDQGSTATTLSGTAAAGAPIIGQVTVKGSLGNSKSALIEADGSYNVDVSGLTAPYRLRAQGTVGGVEYKLHSYAETADLGNTINITPFTDLIIANAAGQIASDYFDASAPADIPPADLAAQEDALQEKLQNILTALGVEETIDLLHTSFSADHTALDAALDIIKVEVDSNTNIATISNIIGNSTPIYDAILDPHDESTPLVAESGLVSAVTERQAVLNVLTDFSALFANSLPGSTQIDPLLSADFLQNDKGKSQMLTEWTTDPNYIGLSLSSTVIKAIDETAGTATVSFNIAFKGVVRPNWVETWTLSRASGKWQLRGNQEIVDRWFDFICETSDYGEGCGINLGADDFDATNNSGAAVLIDSAKVTLMRAGSPVSGGVVYMGVPANGTAGELRVYDSDYSDDHMAFGSSALQIAPGLFQVGDELQFELFTAPLDLTDASAPAVTGTAIATYSTPITAVPLTTNDSPLFPTATPATVTAFNAYTTDGGDLNIGWVIPTGQTIDEVMFQACDNSDCIDVWKWMPSGASVTLNIDTSSLALADAPYRTELRVYSLDAQGRTFLHSYNGTANTPGSSSGGSSTFNCSYESGWDDTAYSGTGGPVTPNSFADYEAVIAACGTAQTFTAADVSGKVLKEVGSLESMTFNAGTGTATTPASGVYDDGEGFTFDFEWWVEAATCTNCNYSYLVIYSDTSIDSNLPIDWVRETAVLTGITGTANAAGAQYSYTKYSEQSTFSNTDRATGSDGEIWHAVDELL